MATEEDDVEYLWTIPALLVRDVERSVAWYRDALGFRVCAVLGEPPTFATLDLAPGRALHLKRAASDLVRSNAAAGVWDVYVEVRGVDRLAEELRGRGTSVSRGPETTAYGMRELEVESPDGHRLCFAEVAG